MDGVTRDSFFNGRIHLKQHRRGYRYSVDAVILASAVHPKPGETVVDLGTGCGIIALILALRQPEARIWGVELQAELSALAEENIRDNDLDSRVRILCADMRDLHPTRFGGPVDRVVSNPPYRRRGSGRVNPDSQRALARHEIAVCLPEVVRAAGTLLKTGGRFTTICAAGRAAELLSHMRAERIEPKRLRGIHSAQGQDARLVLIEGMRAGGPGMTIGPPLIVYDAEGRYTEEMQAMFRP